jgi:hypothetical protein
LTAAKFLGGVPIANLTEPGTPSSDPFDLSDIPLPEAGTTEDCLFLDVLVPKSIYEATVTSTSKGGELPGLKGTIR